MILGRARNLHRDASTVTRCRPIADVAFPTSQVARPFQAPSEEIRSHRSSYQRSTRFDLGDLSPAVAAPLLNESAVSSQELILMHGERHSAMLLESKSNAVCLRKMSDGLPAFVKNSTRAGIGTSIDDPRWR
jgi:hypothetical protein